MNFIKMHGAGNDFVCIDGFGALLPSDPADVARQVCDRHYGVGADGLLLISPSAIAAAKVEIYNADGSEAEMCGNGIRCAARYLYDYGLCRRLAFTIEVGKRVVPVTLEVQSHEVHSVCVDMGPPILDPADIPTTLSGVPIVDVPLEVVNRRIEVTCVSMGNPHCVVFADEGIDDAVLRLGPELETHPVFPKRVNAEFVEIISQAEVRQRTWERGVGETLACGSGACAVCVAGVLSGRTSRKLRVSLRGGVLTVEWNEVDGHLYLTGPAVKVYSGRWTPSPHVTMGPLDLATRKLAA